MRAYITIKRPVGAMDYVDLHVALRLSDELIKKSMEALQALEERNTTIKPAAPRGNLRRRVGVSRLDFT